jgi:hypothetical protein
MKQCAQYFMRYVDDFNLTDFSKGLLLDAALLDFSISTDLASSDYAKSVPLSMKQIHCIKTCF